MAGLSLSLGLGLGGNHPVPQTPEHTICNAIHGKKWVTFTRNSRLYSFAPHALYWKQNKPNELLLDGVIALENGVAPNHPKISTFKLDDLSAVAASQTSFETFVGFHSNDAKYASKTRCIIQTI